MKRSHSDHGPQSDPSGSDNISPKQIMRSNSTSNLDEEAVPRAESDNEKALRDFVKDRLASNEDFQTAASKLKQFNGYDLTLDDLDDWLDGGGTDYSEWQIMLLRSYEHAIEEVKPTTGSAEHDPPSIEDQEECDD